MPPLALQDQPVAFFSPTYAPHLQLFRCHAQHLDLSREACASFHLRRHTVACARCPIGAAHAGRSAPPRHQGESTCARCERIGQRIVRGRLCVSCFNREAEVERGYNRKGVPPQLVLYAADLLVSGPPPVIGFAREPVDDSHMLLSCLVRDPAELERTIQRIEAGGTKVLDSSIGPRRPLTIFKPCPSTHGRHDWNGPRDQHHQKPRSHPHGLHSHP